MLNDTQKAVRQFALNTAVAVHQKGESGLDDLMQDARQFYQFVIGADVVLDDDLDEKNAQETLEFLHHLAMDAGMEVQHPGEPLDVTDVIPFPGVDTPFDNLPEGDQPNV